MNVFKKSKLNNGLGSNLIKKYVKFRRSIFGRVVLIITILSIFLFVSFGIIFRSVYDQYLNTVILQSGNNVGSLVEGALYHSMLENDKGSLQSTLDVIHTLSGIEDVNMYDSDDNLVYSSFTSDTAGHNNANCKKCHENLGELFPGNLKSYKIITAESECKMNNTIKGHRHLLIRTPILNSKSCYTSSCHAHKPTDQVLGSLVIKVPLKELDAAVKKSSMEFYSVGNNYYTIACIITYIIYPTGNKKAVECADKGQCCCFERRQEYQGRN